MEVNTVSELERIGLILKGFFQEQQNANDSDFTQNDENDDALDEKPILHYTSTDRVDETDELEVSN